MLKKVLTLALAMSVLMAGALPAFAEELEEGPTPIYYKKQQVVVFAIDGECMLDAEVDIDFTVEDDGSISFLMAPDVEETVSIVSQVDVPVDESLAGCRAFSVEGPNGQVNHGTFVSNLMHFLKKMGIKGSDKKEFKQALKGYGQGDYKVKANDDEGATSEDETSEVEELKVKPVKADKSKKDKPDKKKSNRGNDKK